MCVCLGRAQLHCWYVFVQEQEEALVAVDMCVCVFLCVCVCVCVCMCVCLWIEPSDTFVAVCSGVRGSICGH